MSKRQNQSDPWLYRLGATRKFIVELSLTPIGCASPILSMVGQIDANKSLSAGRHRRRIIKERLVAIHCVTTKLHSKQEDLLMKAMTELV